jgi:apoptosis-inducing factor 3
VDNGVVVNGFLETSSAGIFAAGDIARWPDARSGALLRVEHWVVAERQGQTAARNMLGGRQVFDAVPYFWTEQYDVTLLYVGHAERGFTASLSGAPSVTKPECRVDYYQDGTLTAVATIGRDRDSLAAEVAFENQRAART